MGISNTTLPFSNPLTLEILSTMSQKMSWQNTDALLTPRTIQIHKPATLRRKNPWAEVLILRLKVIIRSMGKRQTETGPFRKGKGIPQRHRHRNGLSAQGKEKEVRLEDAVLLEKEEKGQEKRKVKQELGPRDHCSRSKTTKILKRKKDENRLSI